MGKNRIQQVGHKRAALLICTMLGTIAILLCSRIPSLAEWYMVHAYPPIATVLSFISGPFPFSLFDCLTVVAVLLLIFGIVQLCRRKLRFKRWLYLFLMTVVWIAIWFYMAWGVAYFRPSFAERYGLAEVTLSVEEFESLTLRLIDSLNQSYCSTDVFSKKEVDEAIEKSYQQRHKQLLLPYPCGKRRTKPTIYQPFQNRVGVSGFFGPFFNEVHVSSFILPPSYPFTLAHEKAHQLGTGSEDECNFLAYVVCTASTHPQVKYSGYYETVGYLLRTLRRLSPDTYPLVYEKIDRHVRDDYRREYEHWQQAFNPRMAEVQNRVYDSYLKTNQVRSGIQSYSEMVKLVITWEYRGKK